MKSHPKPGSVPSDSSPWNVLQQKAGFLPSFRPVAQRMIPHKHPCCWKAGAGHQVRGEPGSGRARSEVGKAAMKGQVVANHHAMPPRGSKAAADFVLGPGVAHPTTGNRRPGVSSLPSPERPAKFREADCITLPPLQGTASGQHQSERRPRVSPRRHRIRPAQGASECHTPQCLHKPVTALKTTELSSVNKWTGCELYLSKADKKQKSLRQKNGKSFPEAINPSLIKVRQPWM